MEIKKGEAFIVTMSYEELIGLKKLIGSTSYGYREDTAGLTEEQNDLIAKIWGYLSKYFENS